MTKQEAIFGPFLALILWTMVVWIFMYYKRIPFIKKNMKKEKVKEMLNPVFFQQMSPPDVHNPSDNLKNLFEVPVLFYALALFLFVTRQVDGIYVFASWVFFIFRVLHSVIHCSYNNVPHRFLTYFISCAAVAFMGVRASVAYFI